MRAMGLRPQTASGVCIRSQHRWDDDGWMAAQCDRDWGHQPCSVYELHAGSWRRHADEHW